MRSRPSRAALAAAVLVLAPAAVAACSGSDGNGDAAAAATDDPCELLSAGAVGRATGWPVTAQDDAASVAGPTCEWVDPDRADRAVQLRLDDGGRAAYDQARTTATERLGDVTDVELAGATAAAEVPDQGVVLALVGDRVVQVTVAGKGAPADAATDLAADVTRRLAAR